MKESMKQVFKAMVLVAMALPLMANQSCEEQQTETRHLKKRVDLYGMTAREFTLPGNVKYNLGAPVSTQLEVAVSDHADFYMSTRAPRANGLELMAFDSTPECVRDVPMYMMGGSVDYFEFVSSTKVSFGYSHSGDFGNVSVNPSVKVDKAQMGLALKAYNPLTRVYSAIGDATSNETKTTINATVNFNDFSVTPEIYLQTPLEKVSRVGLEKALAKLAEKLKDEPWTAQVLEDQDRYIIINAGRKAGLKKGDVLTVHNQLYSWQNNGAPCQVPLAYQKDQRPGNPTAIITLDVVEEHFSISAVDPTRPTDEAVHAGAVVRLKEFAPVAAIQE